TYATEAGGRRRTCGYDAVLLLQAFDSVLGRGTEEAGNGAFREDARVLGKKLLKLAHFPTRVGVRRPALKVMSKGDAPAEVQAVTSGLSRSFFSRRGGALRTSLEVLYLGTEVFYLRKQVFYLKLEP